LRLSCLLLGGCRCLSCRHLLLQLHHLCCQSCIQLLLVHSRLMGLLLQLHHLCCSL
jgi:hypothetical protein